MSHWGHDSWETELIGKMNHQKHDYVERHDSHEIMTVRDMNPPLRRYYCVNHERHDSLGTWLMRNTYLIGNMTHAVPETWLIGEHNSTSWGVDSCHLYGLTCEYDSYTLMYSFIWPHMNEYMIVCPDMNECRIHTHSYEAILWVNSQATHVIRAVVWGHTNVVIHNTHNCVEYTIHTIVLICMSSHYCVYHVDHHMYGDTQYTQLCWVQLCHTSQITSLWMHPPAPLDAPTLHKSVYESDNVTLNAPTSTSRRAYTTQVSIWGR